jgi:hypothetical protein
MIAAIWLVVYVFAVYRLSELFANDVIFDGLRRKVAQRAAVGGAAWKFIADLIHCPLCIGVWLALPTAFLYDMYVLNIKNLLNVFILWLGIAGMQYLLSSLSLESD